MSHHLDMPLAGQNGQLYLDDLYVFAGDRSSALVMDVNSTITGSDVQGGFHPQARYECKVHFDGADVEASGATAAVLGDSVLPASRPAVAAATLFGEEVEWAVSTYETLPRAGAARKLLRRCAGGWTNERS
jgi:hypothetical protein